MGLLLFRLKICLTTFFFQCGALVTQPSKNFVYKVVNVDATSCCWQPETAETAVSSRVSLLSELGTFVPFKAKIPQLLWSETFSRVQLILVYLRPLIRVRFHSLLSVNEVKCGSLSSCWVEMNKLPASLSSSLLFLIWCPYSRDRASMLTIAKKFSSNLFHFHIPNKRKVELNWTVFSYLHVSVFTLTAPEHLKLQLYPKIRNGSKVKKLCDVWLCCPWAGCSHRVYHCH